MMVSLRIVLVLIVGIVLMWALRECSPFSYLDDTTGGTMLKGGVAR
jgi:hypothetical protein